MNKLSSNVLINIAATAMVMLVLCSGTWGLIELSNYLFTE